jgi:hypothetical protein
MRMKVRKNFKGMYKKKDCGWEYFVQVIVDQHMVVTFAMT